MAGKIDIFDRAISYVIMFDRAKLSRLVTGFWKLPSLP